jgi:hypothetical protein
MQSKTLKQCLAFSLLLAALAWPATSVKPQDRKWVPIDAELAIKGACPKPISLTLTAAKPLSFDPADFNSGQVSQLHATGLGDPGSDRNYLHTFRWKRPDRCCQITKAILTVKMKSNQRGITTTSSDAGNDGIAIMHNHLVAAPYNEAVYSGINRPFPVGQPATKTWNLNAAVLSYINTTGNLSFAVQDDTTVVSATLQLWGCCLSDSPAKAIELTGPREQK